MKRSFWSTIKGKFLSRTLVAFLVPSVLIVGLAVGALRSVSTRAQDSADAVQQALRDQGIDPSALAPLDDFAADAASTSTSAATLLALAVFAGAALAAIIGVAFGRRISEPVAALRRRVEVAAEVTLPQLITQMDDCIENGTEIPELTPLALRTGDELEDLAQSFNGMQDAAALLALHQATTRHQSTAAFVNLGRRNQNLLARQIEEINAMERGETDPEGLERLFQLDHLATRMRRNAKSLLVLAGEDPPRRFRKPVSVRKLVQAATGEIEHFSRVEYLTLDDADIDGGPASDLAHLLAELLENATMFAPPTTLVEVAGRRSGSEYVLQIVDRGIGLSEEEIATSNLHLAGETNFEFAKSMSRLGHHVVGRLAERHDVRVELSTTVPGGVTATVTLPTSVLAANDSAAPRAARTAALQATTPDAVTADGLAAYEQKELSPADYDLLARGTASPTPAAAVGQTAVAGSGAGVQLPLDQLKAIDSALDADPTVPTQVAPVLTKPAISDPALSAGPASGETPAGLRQRRRGEEGAPVGLQEPKPGPAERRSPEEVKASLQRFTSGVASGRADATGIAKPPATEGDQA